MKIEELYSLHHDDSITEFQGIANKKILLFESIGGRNSSIGQLATTKPEGGHHEEGADYESSPEQPLRAKYPGPKDGALR
jgi:hypothetical protein